MEADIGPEAKQGLK